jgi:hypothetical protein
VIAMSAASASLRVPRLGAGTALRALLGHAFEGGAVIAMSAASASLRVPRLGDGTALRALHRPGLGVAL